jgi:acyl-CoA dehydrogenase
MSVLNVPKPAWRDEEDLNIFEDAVGRFLQEHAPPEAGERWREQGIVDRDVWTRAGEAGLLCLSAPEEYGGMGGDYRHEVILMEQLGRYNVDSWGVSLHNAIVAPYITHYGTEEQKRRWLPKLASASTSAPSP